MISKKDINKIWLTGDSIWIALVNGDILKENFADYKRLKEATPDELSRYQTSYFGVHWPDLDEDLSFEGFKSVI